MIKKRLHEVNMKKKPSAFRTEEEDLSYDAVYERGYQQGYQEGVQMAVLLRMAEALLEPEVVAELKLISDLDELESRLWEHLRKR